MARKTLHHFAEPHKTATFVVRILLNSTEGKEFKRSYRSQGCLEFKANSYRCNDFSIFTAIMAYGFNFCNFFIFF